MKKTIFFLTVIAFVCTMTLEPFIVMNDIVPVFPDEERDKIEGFIIEGTIHFLQAKSNTDMLLLEYEKSAKQAIDYPAALGYAAKAREELEISKMEYEKAIAAGTQAGYLPGKIQEFKNFQYASIMANKNVDTGLMAKAQDYLGKGDILGAYRENVNNIDTILVTLRQIEAQLSTEETPGISMFWELLQQFSQAALFGNYCTMTASLVLQ